MIKVKLSSYYRQVITALVASTLLGLGFFIVFKTGWTFIIIPVFMAFYAKDINRCFYLLSDKRKKNFKTGTFVYAGDIDVIKRSAERSKNITEGRLGSARMTMVSYQFKKYGAGEDSEVKEMVLYVPDSINYRYVLSRILGNKDHRFIITYGEKSGVITEFKS